MITIDFSLILKDSKNTLLNPRSYFSKLKVSGGMTAPVIKATVYGIFTGLIYLLCYLFKIKTLGAGYTGMAVGFPAFVKILFGAVAGLFIGAVILVIISSICKGLTDFENSLVVTASIMALLPVYGILSISWAINIYFGMAISLIVFLYFLWLLYHALVYSLKCKPEYATILGYVLTGLIILLMLLNLKSSGNQNKMNTVVKKNTREVRKMK
jgi:hypothetical protein